MPLGGETTKLITIHHVDNILASSFTIRLQMDCAPWNRKQQNSKTKNREVQTYIR